MGGYHKFVLPESRLSVLTMVLTKDFKDFIKNWVARDPVFREELRKEGIECPLTSDVDTGKAVLRDFINATVGFDATGTITAQSLKSLMRMFGSKGNPQVRNFFLDHCPSSGT